MSATRRVRGAPHFGPGLVHLATVDAKRAAHAETGAVAVEMESAAIAAVATRAGVPFACVRAVLDPASSPLEDAGIFIDPQTGAVRPMALARHLAGHEAAQQQPPGARPPQLPEAVTAELVLARQLRQRHLVEEEADLLAEAAVADPVEPGPQALAGQGDLQGPPGVGVGPLQGARELTALVAEAVGEQADEAERLDRGRQRRRHRTDSMPRRRAIPVPGPGTSRPCYKVSPLEEEP